MQTLKRYKVVICPKCGEVQTSEAEESFKCRSCHATRKMFSDKVIGTNIRVLASYDHPLKRRKAVVLKTQVIYKPPLEYAYNALK